MRAIGFLGVLLVASCGGASSAPDATPDLVIDGEVEVRLGPRVDIAPYEYDVTVFASGLAGEVGRPTSTVDDEVVRIGVQTGGSVTAIYDGRDKWIVTYVAVEPGDVLQLGERPESGSSGPRGDTWLTVPAVTDATHYAVESACGIDMSTQPAFYLELNISCEPDPTADLLVLAMSETTLLQWARLDDVTIGGDMSDPVVVTSWSPPEQFTITLENAGDAAAYRVEGSPVVEELDAPMLLLSGSNAGDPLSGSALWALGTETWVLADLTTAEGAHRIRSDILLADATTWSLDASTLTPELSGLAYDFTRYEVADVRWSHGNESYDGVLVDFAWTRGGYFRWIVIAPPGEVVTFPAMPREQALLVPELTDSDLSLTVDLIDFDDIASYGELRARPEWLLEDPRGPTGPGSWNQRFSATTATTTSF